MAKKRKPGTKPVKKPKPRPKSRPKSETTQYELGGLLDFARNYGSLMLDNQLSAIGLTDVIDDDNFKGKSAGFFKKTANITNPLSTAATSMALNAVAPGAGSAVTGIGGQANTSMNQQELSKEQAQMLAQQQYRSKLNNQIQQYRMGGKLYQDGGILDEFKGASHEQGGIPLGNNNEVEGGETKMEDYVFSDTLVNPITGKTFADDSLKIKKKYGLRTNDSISRDTMKQELNDLQIEQETLKLKQEMQSQSRVQSVGAGSAGRGQKGINDAALPRQLKGQLKHGGTLHPNNPIDPRLAALVSNNPYGNLNELYPNTTPLGERSFPTGTNNYSSSLPYYANTGTNIPSTYASQPSNDFSENPESSIRLKGNAEVPGTELYSTEENPKYAFTDELVNSIDPISAQLETAPLPGLDLSKLASRPSAEDGSTGYNIDALRQLYNNLENEGTTGNDLADFGLANAGNVFDILRGTARLLDPDPVYSRTANAQNIRPNLINSSVQRQQVGSSFSGLNKDIRRNSRGAGNFLSNRIASAIGEARGLSEVESNTSRQNANILNQIEQFNSQINSQTGQFNARQQFAADDLRQRENDIASNTLQYGLTGLGQGYAQRKRDFALERMQRNILENGLLDTPEYMAVPVVLPNGEITYKVQFKNQVAE